MEQVKERKRRGGRVKGVKNKATREIKEILDKVVDWHVVVQRLYELVDGITVQETYKNGETVVYSRAPDAYAAKTLIEFRYGKAQQSMKLDGGATPLVTDVRIEIVKAS